jgi:hypothetical protein
MWCSYQKAKESFSMAIITLALMPLYSNIQAEVKAVQKAALWLNSQGFRNKIIRIHSDSQAFLQRPEDLRSMI